MKPIRKPWRIIVLILLILLCAALYNKEVFAETRTYVDGDGDSSRITDEPCANQVVLGMIHESVHELFKEGTSKISGVEYRMCWRRAGSLVFLVYEDGDKGTLPWAWFKPGV